MTINVPGLEITSSANTKSDYGRWLIHGPQGSGKTTFASTVATLGKTLFIDLIGEQGTRSFEGAPYAKNIDIARPTSITMFDELFWQLDKGGHGYKAVVIDSLTSVQKMAMRYLQGHDETAVREIKQGAAPATFGVWGQALDIMVDTATFWYGLAAADRDEPMHVVMTAQSKRVGGDDGEAEEIVPDVQRGALSIVCATPDYIVYTDTEENMDFLSDDSQPPVKHVIKFGSHPGYRTKARVPVQMRGKLPPIMGRDKQPNLLTLSRQLGIGGAPASKTRAKEND